MELVSDLLTVHGYTVLQATTGQEALTLAAREQPDLILMDIGLPGMDGLAACRALKAGPATVTIPVVALTAYVMRGDEEKILAAGYDGYITKPIDTRQFAHTVARFLR
jgi:CheY-like chemotaxis protein